MTPNHAIYLDYAATTPVDPRVAAVMAECLTADGVFGNPDSLTHEFGLGARLAVEKAREQFAALIGADSREVVFTSGATESNNLAIQGAALRHRTRGNHVITMKTEHKAVLDVCAHLEKTGFRVTYLDPETNGLIDIKALESAITADTILVSIMQVNNETGALQDIAAIAELTRSRGALLHVDAAQGAGKVAIDLAALKVDLMSFSAHKIYGPKGAGALYVRRRPRVNLTPLFYGGSQEHGLRPGTLPVHQIVGMGEACEIAAREMQAEQSRIRTFRVKFLMALAQLEAITLNGHVDQNVAGIINLHFDGVYGESLLAELRPLALSAGSACTSANSEPSHVLKAMGLSDIQTRESLRVSIGRFTTNEQIDIAVGKITQGVGRLRAISPQRVVESAEDSLVSLTSVSR